MFCRSIGQTGKLFVGILQRIILFCFVFCFFLPQDAQHTYFSLIFGIFVSSFSSVVMQRKRQIFLWILAAFDMSRTMISARLTKSFPLHQVPVYLTRFVSSLTHFDAKPFSWRGTECKREHRRSVTAYIHIQAQRASVCHLAPALFFLCCFPPKKSTLALGPGPERTEDQRRLWRCILWGGFLLSLLG